MAISITQQNPSVSIAASDSGSIDAFGRWRVSTPLTLFDSKQLYDKAPLFWSEATSGTATCTHSISAASTTMRVASAGDYAIRQTKQRFNYQPGKGFNILITGVFGTPVANVTQRVGYFNSLSAAPFSTDIDGYYLYDNGTTKGVALCKLGVENAVPQSNWNIDKFDGTGPSRLTLDWTKSQIFSIDFEWLGVGRVRMGFVIDGKYYYCHEFVHSNRTAGVYVSSPNHSIRYEIRSTGGIGTLEQICSTVQSEGGYDQTGVYRSYDTGLTVAQALDVNVNVEHAVLGIRLKPTHLSASVSVKSLQILTTTNTNVLWRVHLNPVVGGTFNYVDVTDSACQIAQYNAAVDPSDSVISSAGTIVYSGYLTDTVDIIATAIDMILRIGCAIDGTRDTLVLSAIVPTGTNEDLYASISWAENL